MKVMALFLKLLFLQQQQGIIIRSHFTAITLSLAESGAGKSEQEIFVLKLVHSEVAVWGGRCAT